MEWLNIENMIFMLKYNFIKISYEEIQSYILVMQYFGAIHDEIISNSSLSVL